MNFKFFSNPLSVPRFMVVSRWRWAGHGPMIPEQRTTTSAQVGRSNTMLGAERLAKKYLRAHPERHVRVYDSETGQMLEVEGSGTGAR